MLAPFPYFGGKRRVADKVWERFGADTQNYIEPFCGSAAVLLNCPFPLKIVTLNDADGFICNFWRAVCHAPEAVAAAADWPVNEIDLFARQVWLVKQKSELAERLQADPAFYDAKIAGWWVWGACAWLGSGWCAGDGPWTVVESEIVNVADLTEKDGVKMKMPHMGDAGRGVNRKLPHLGDAGQGDVLDYTRAHLTNYMRALQSALRQARVACGDFERVLSDSVTWRHGQTAVFLDPPYGDGDVDYGNGGNASKDVAERAKQWAIAHGDDPRLRIALCGYDDLQMPGTWSPMRWKAPKGYQKSENSQAHREIVWFSPHCLRVELFTWI